MLSPSTMKVSVVQTFSRITTNMVVDALSVASVNEYRKFVSCTASMKLVCSIPSTWNLILLPNLRLAIGLWKQLPGNKIGRRIGF